MSNIGTINGILYHMARNGLKLKWLKGLASKPNRANDRGICSQKIFKLNQRGVIAAVGMVGYTHTKIWVPRIHYAKALSFQEGKA
jgi:hypothetical protein